MAIKSKAAKNVRRRRQPRTAVSDRNESGNRGLNKRRADGDSEDSWEKMEPNKHAATILEQKELQEILGEVTQGELQKYSIFITNLCAISKFCLNRAPDLLPEVEDYVEKDMGSSHGLLTFILKGPHHGIIPQDDLPSLWSKEDSGVSANEPNPSKQQPSASSPGTPITPQWPAAVARPEGAKGQSARPDHPPQAPQTTQAASMGTIQRPALTGSAPAPQQTGQRPLQGQGSSGPLPPGRGAAGLNFTSYGQQSPLPLVSTAAPESVPTGQNPPQTAHFASAVQSGQAPQWSSDAVHQGSSTAQPFPVSTALQAPHISHPIVNPGFQPGMAQPLQMHAGHQSQPTPLNFVPMQSQTPAAHPAFTQLHAGQLAGQGWTASGPSQLPSQVTQPQPGPTVSNSSVQPTAFPPSQQWATNPVRSTQGSNQVTASAQPGNTTLPTQFLSQVQGTYAQPGLLHMFTHPSAAQSQADTAHNPPWLGQLQEGNMAENEFLSLGDLPSVFQ